MFGNSRMFGGGQTRSGFKSKKFEITKEKCLNYYFALWLKEWYEEAAMKDSRTQFIYKRALESVLEHKERLMSGKEAGKLKFIGENISMKLDRKIEELIRGGGKLFDDDSGVTTVASNFDSLIPINQEEERPKPKAKKSKSEKSKSTEPKTEKTSRKKEYTPGYRTGPYGILLALLMDSMKAESGSGLLSEKQLSSACQPYCSSSLNEGTFSVVGCGLKTLLKHELVKKWGAPSRYSLTPEGVELAKKLWKSGEKRESQSSLPDLPIPVGGGKSQKEIVNLDSDSDVDIEMTRHPEVNETIVQSNIEPYRVFNWPAGSFQVTLLVDLREAKSREERTYFSDRLEQMGIKVEVRNLEIGDFLWVAKRSIPDHMSGDPALDSEEVVLDVLIERKREDDLCMSICDGRFKEQKHRISRSLVKNKFYLVEKYENTDFTAIGFDKYYAAVIQSQVVDGLMVRYTSGLEDTINFLNRLHLMMRARWERTALTAVHVTEAEYTYKEFRSRFEHTRFKYPSVLLNVAAFSLLNSKTGNQSQQDLFLKQLMCIRGLSGSKAAIISKKYPAPRLLHNALSTLNERDRENFFRDYTDANDGEESGAAAVAGRKFGFVVSRRIGNIFTKEMFGENEGAIG